MATKFEGLIKAVEYFSDRQRCIDLLIKIRWKCGDVHCVFCQHDKIYTLQGKNKRYKCAKCHKQFSITKGTVFENSPISLQKWFTALYLLVSNKKGISSMGLARDIKVTQKTAWFMLHRLRHLIKNRLQEKLTGLLQIDETFVGGKNKNRPWHKKVKYSQGRSFKDKTPVLGILDDIGNIYTKVIPNTQAASIIPIINRTIEKGSIIVTDEWKAYKQLGKHYQHLVVDHGRSQYVNEQGFTTNGLEGAWSHLKRMIIGIYHQVSRKHLHRYCDEFAFRYNTRTFSEEERFIRALCKVDRRLKYKYLIAERPFK